MLLNCHTWFSLLYGTLSPVDLMNAVRDAGYQELVVTDINNTSAILDMVRVAGEHGLKVIAGVDVRNGAQQQYVVIAKNNDGYREMNEHLSRHLHEEMPFETQAPEFSNCFVIYPFRSYRGWPLRDNEMVGVAGSELNSFEFLNHKVDEKKLVVLDTLTFITKKQHNIHRLLRAIDNNALLSRLSADEQAPLTHCLRTQQEQAMAFKDQPIIVSNTRHVLQQCSIEFTFGKLANKNLRHVTGSTESDRQRLRELAYAGLEGRYPNANETVIERVEKELNVIAEMDFTSYFLINYEIIQYAQQKNYFYVGRGSGANSIVAYLLRITDVDPLELDLYFERFINKHRTNAPDFDIDFSWNNRDDVTDFIFRRFGTERTALLGTYSTFQSDAMTRELGKVFGLPPQEIDKLQKSGPTDEIGHLIIRYSKLIHGFPHHLGIHASGILISEEPIHAYSATFMPPKGYPTTQFSMLEAEDIGLFKFDILSQRGLGKIKDALEIIEQQHGVKPDIHDMRRIKSDTTIQKLLETGRCIGCFYIESPGMRMLLSKLQANDYLSLVAASSIIRPGVSKSGMMREYILRYREPWRREKARKENPALYDLLKETYGVMVYQEDVIKIAHIFAGLSLEDADYLRRGMSWKFKARGEFDKVRDRFFSQCKEKGYDDATVLNIWTQIESFANFAFSKGHSASYAVESYQALFLKAYYPLEYMVATLNNGGGFYRKEIYLHEARMHGATVEPPCINVSTALSQIRGKTIYLGFGLIDQLEINTITQVVREREINGPFTDLYDFVRRVAPSMEQLRLLIRSGAFHNLEPNKKKLLWDAHMLVSPVRQPASAELFDLTPQKYELPALTHHPMEDAIDELELFGFSLVSPFKLVKDLPAIPIRARDMRQMEGQQVQIVGYLVNVKYTGTSAQQRMSFGTFLDEDGDWIDTVHFPPSLKAHPFSGPGCYRISGKVTVEFDFVTIDVDRMYRLTNVSLDDLGGK